MATQFIITATAKDNSGNRVHCDRYYAIGDHADTKFETREAAERVADDLRDDVGTVVDASVEYEVVEY